jgi:SAM-dependent methyltransferase
MSAAELLERWRSDLESWAIPGEILAGTPESPWVLPRELVTRRAERRTETCTGPSCQRAWDALAEQGSVLDVGAGTGAACLPLLARASTTMAVDVDEGLLRVLVENADRLGRTVIPVCGRWPEVAGEVEPADVVTCHHVLYNVADLGPFIAALTSHARRLVVVELTSRHPLTGLNALWQRFHGVARPEVPTAHDAFRVLEELGLAPACEVWSRVGEADHGSFDDMVEVARRRLCLGPGRAGEVASVLRELGAEGDNAVDLRATGSDLVTIWWSGRV